MGTYGEARDYVARGNFYRLGGCSRALGKRHFSKYRTPLKMPSV
jgi:hypothetical protein